MRSAGNGGMRSWSFPERDLHETVAEMGIIMMRLKLTSQERVREASPLR